MKITIRERVSSLCLDLFHIIEPQHSSRVPGDDGSEGLQPFVVGVNLTLGSGHLLVLSR